MAILSDFITLGQEQHCRSFLWHRLYLLMKHSQSCCPTGKYKPPPEQCQSFLIHTNICLPQPDMRISQGSNSTRNLTQYCLIIFRHQTACFTCNCYRPNQRAKPLDVEPRVTSGCCYLTLLCRTPYFPDSEKNLITFLAHVRFVRVVVLVAIPCITNKNSQICFKIKLTSFVH